MTRRRWFWRVTVPSVLFVGGSLYLAYDTHGVLRTVGTVLALVYLAFVAIVNRRLQRRSRKTDSR